MENIKQGLERFHYEHGRYPTAEEIDAYPHLPSSRQIQRAFGGLLALRKQLGLEITNYAQGMVRSEQASLINARGSEAERRIESRLISHFGEYFVHAEKPLYKYFTESDFDKSIGKRRADFLIYHREGVFCVDVFVARNIHTLKRIINIKERTYSGLSIEIFFVNGGLTHSSANQDIIRFINNKHRKLENNMHILNEKDFLSHILMIKPLTITPI